MINILPDTATPKDINDVLTKLNTLSEGLGCAGMPYNRLSGQSLNLKALDEMLTMAIDLLNSDAEEDPIEIEIPDNVRSFPTSVGGASGYTPTAGRPSVGPQNSMLAKSIAKFSGWSADLLKTIDLVAVALTKEEALQLIEIFIKDKGYNPAAQEFTIVRDIQRQVYTVSEKYSSANKSITFNELATAMATAVKP